MIPILYQPGEKDYSTGGIGFMNDCKSCIVSEEANGQYTATLKFAITTKYAEYLEDVNYQIKAKPNDEDDYMIFDIYKHYKEMATGLLYVYAKAQTFRLSRRTVKQAEISGQNGIEAMKILEGSMNLESDIKMFCDITATGSTSFDAINPLTCIKGTQGSLLQTYGGEIRHEPLKISLLKRRGRDNVMTFRYKKNLDGLKLTLDWENICTQIEPYADVQSADGVTERIYGNPVQSQYMNNYDDVYSLSVQFTEEQGVTDEASLNSVAKKYFTTMNPGIDKPKVNIEIDIRKLPTTSKNKRFTDFRKIGLFDTFSIYHERFAINLTAKVVAVEYDSLLGKNLKLTAGEPKYTFFQQQTHDLQDVLKKIPTKYYASLFVDYVSSMITGNNGGHVVLWPKEEPSDILIMDTPDVNTAQQVLRMNKSGIGFSKNGWQGDYDTAWTMDGTFNANFIRAGILRGIEIIGCIFKSDIEAANNYTMMLDESGLTFRKKDADQESAGASVNVVTDSSTDETSFSFELAIENILAGVHIRPKVLSIEHPTKISVAAPLIKLGNNVEVRSDGLYVDGQKVTGGGSGGGGGDLGTIEDYAKNMITSEFNVDYDKMYSSYQNFGRIQTWGLTSRATFDELNQIIRENGVSPVFFWAYEGGEGYHPSLSFLNHFYKNGSSYQEECRRTAAWVKETSLLSGSLAWYDAQYPYYTSPADKQAVGNAYMAETVAGMIARVMLQGTAAATWAMFDPAALKGSVNGVQDYADPFAHQITLIQSWQKPQAYIAPLDSPITVTSPFGGRTNPITGEYQFHSGIDLVNGNLTAPIYAIAAGTVIYSGIASGYGEYIAIQHADGIISGYGHMASGSRTVSLGETVGQGQQIATIGTTGSSTGIHLDLQMKTSLWPANNDGFMDPASYISF